MGTRCIQRVDVDDFCVRYWVACLFLSCRPGGFPSTKDISLNSASTASRMLVTGALITERGDLGAQREKSMLCGLDEDNSIAAWSPHSKEYPNANCMRGQISLDEGKTIVLHICKGRQEEFSYTQEPTSVRLARFVLTVPTYLFFHFLHPGPCIVQQSVCINSTLTNFTNIQSEGFLCIYARSRERRI